MNSLPEIPEEILQDIAPEDFQRKLIEQRFDPIDQKVTRHNLVDPTNAELLQLFTEYMMEVDLKFAEFEAKLDMVLNKIDQAYKRSIL